MKKTLAIVLAALMAFSLFACNTTSETDTPDSSAAVSNSTTADGESNAPEVSQSAASDAQANAPASDGGNEVELGYFDSSIDYSAQPRYNVVYMTTTTNVLYEMFNSAFQAWADRMNCEYSFYCSNNDYDLFITTIETYAAQRIDGYITDPDTTIYPRVSEVLNDLELPWMGAMGRPEDENGKLVHPEIGFDHVIFGEEMAQWIVDYAKQTWPEATPEETVMLALTYSPSPEMHDRSIGAKNIWDATYPGMENNFIVADGASYGNFNADTGFNISAPVMSSHPEFKYWLICTPVDDYADGAARAAEQAGIDKTTVVSTCGGSGLINHWDAGEDSCWKSAVYVAQTLYAEPIFCGLYAMMQGKATAETLWPQWVNHSINDEYASVLLKTVIITKDNYQEYMEWVDAYTGIDMSDYPYNGTQFMPYAEVPASYAG